MAKKNQRIKLYNTITASAEKEISSITDRELWLIGIALYWAEGDKEKDYRPGTGVRFSNSDPRMIFLFLRWLIKICKVSKEKIFLEIYIHENYKNEVQRFKDYWSRITGFSVEKFNKIYFKTNKINSKRKNQGGLYNGLLRVNVYESSSLNRKVSGWVNGIVKKCGIV